MPVNLYGLRDNFDPTSSHFMPALIRQFAEAQNSSYDTAAMPTANRAAKLADPSSGHALVRINADKKN